MGWYGDWNIKYHGKDSEKFANLAKLIIPNYVKRFEETEKGVLDCKRRLSWYNADVDISKIMEYLDENDTIDVEIDGETHPIRGKRRIPQEEAKWNEYAFEEDGEYYVYDEYNYEKQTFKKENGKVIIDNEHPDDSRYKNSNLGISNMFAYEIAYPKMAKESELEGDIDTIDSYINYIAQQFAVNDEIMPAVQDFIYSISDSQKLKDLANKEYNFLNHIVLDEKVLDKIANIREQFKTVESAKAYLEQVKEQSSRVEKQDKIDERPIPNFIANMSEKDINNLGGLNQLLKLVEVKGEDSTKELLTMLGYKIEPSLEELEAIKAEQERREQAAKNLFEKYVDKIKNSDRLLDMLGQVFEDFDEEEELGK